MINNFSNLSMSDNASPTLIISGDINLGFDIQAFSESVLSLLQIENGHFEFNFVDESTIVGLNQTHLDRDYVTDVISFNLAESGEAIHGDVYICAQKALENAGDYGESFDGEIQRLIVHGALHLLGYRDYTDAEKTKMFSKQEALLRQAQELL